MHPEDTAFADYCRLGSPHQLATVFEATVGELLRVAHYLAPDRSVAEDLVQSTYLIAIERRAHYDPTQPVLPWLLGILANAARHERRRRARPSPPAEAAATEDPAATAIGAELQASCAEALRGLPQPYRQVLLLRLEHGLDTAAIAEVTGSKPATVRTWIARGMELLRRALPVGVAGGFAMSASAASVGAESIARLRAAVLATLPQVAATTAATSALLSIAMKKLLAVAVACALLVVGWGLVATVASPAQPSSPVDRATSTDRALDAVPAASDRAANVVAEEAPRTAANVKRCALRVQLARANGVPFGMALVAVLADGRDEVRQAHTDGNGWVVFADLPLTTVRVQTGRAVATPVALQPGDNVLQLTLPAFVAVHGKVVERAGAPVADADVFVVRGDLRDGAHWLARSDAEGQFVVDDVEPGSVLMARAAGWQPSNVVRGSTVPPARGGTAEMTLVLGDRATLLRGRVLGPDGQPSPGAELVFAVDEDRRKQSATPTRPRAADGNERGPDREPLLVRAAADGSFTVHELPSGEVVVLARSAAGQPKGAAVARFEIAERGPTEHDVVLAPAAAVVGTLRDEQGQPYAGVTLRGEWRGNAQFGRLEGAWAEALVPTVCTDERGEFVLEPLWPGQVLLRDAQGRTRPREALQLLAGERRQLELVMPRRQDVVVRVLGPDGTPLRDQGVWVDSDPTATPRRLVLLAQRTGEDGRCTVRNVTTAGPWHVAVYAPVAEDEDDPLDRFPMHVFAARPTTDELVVQLHPNDLPTATLVARFTDRNGAPVSAPAVTLRRAGWREVRRVRAGGDALVATALPAGTYWLDLGSDLAFGPFELVPGQRLDVGSLNAEAFGRLRLQLRAPNGAALGKAAGVLLGDEIRPERELRFVDGALVHDRVAAGRRRVLVFAEGLAASEHDIDVQVGIETVREIQVDAGYLQEFVLAPDVLVGAERIEFELYRGGVTRVASGTTSTRRFQVPMREGTWTVRFGLPDKGKTPQTITAGAVAAPPIVLRSR